MSSPRFEPTTFLIHDLIHDELDRSTTAVDWVSIYMLDHSEFIENIRDYYVQSHKQIWLQEGKRKILALTVEPFVKTKTGPDN